MKTGLELKKKAFQPKLGAISFGNKPPTAFMAPSTVRRNADITKRDSFGLPFAKPLNPVQEETGVDNRVKTMLGNGLKLQDLKNKQSIAGLEGLRKKVIDGTAPSHSKLHERRKTLLSKPSTSSDLD